MARGRKKGPPDKSECYSTELKCELSAAEVAQRADRAATVLAARDEKVAEAKAAAKHAKGVVETLESELRTLSGEVRSRATFRRVECERRYNYRRGLVTVTRLDTRSVVEERKMTEVERQMHLPFPDPETNGDAPQARPRVDGKSRAAGERDEDGGPDSAA